MISLILLVIMGIAIEAKEDTFKYLKFPHDRKIPDFSNEFNHFALLDNMDLKPLPLQFSICSSVLVEYFRDYPTFFSIMTDEPSRWITVEINQNLKSETYYVWFLSNSAYKMGDKTVNLRKYSTIPSRLTRIFSPMGL